MDRRRFIAGAVGLLTAPALVRASSLDYVPRAEKVLPWLEVKGVKRIGEVLEWQARTAKGWKTVGYGGTLSVPAQQTSLPILFEYHSAGGVLLASTFIQTPDPITGTFSGWG